ncbi:MAG: nucleotidyltransferase domain-containing protein [Caldilineaceae bacterium]
MLTATGNATADRILHGLVGILEVVFPGRIRGYYLEGSYADQTALTTSDIDLIILFKGSFIDETEHAKAEQIVEHYSMVSALELDVSFLDEKQIATGVPPALKLGSTVLFGEPAPNEFPLVSVTEWGRERMHAAYWLTTKVFGRPPVVTYPRDYPRPEAEFYGYTERTIRFADGNEVPSTRDLIRVMGWAATALVAYQGKQVVPRKKECHLFYRTYINDEWSALFEAIYHQCRTQWHYRIPEQTNERHELRRICRRALAFENHFLDVYKQFLLSELHGADLPAKRHALWVQGKIPYMDQEIIATVRALVNRQEEALHEAATDALHALER